MLTDVIVNNTLIVSYKNLSNDLVVLQKQITMHYKSDNRHLRTLMIKQHWKELTSSGVFWSLKSFS